MQKINLSSPYKENKGNAGFASPNKRKGQQTVVDLLDFIKTNGLVLPPHLSKLVSTAGNPQSPLKTANKNGKETARQQNDVKQLKVQLSECQFQLKKVQEDLADFRRQTKIQKEKQAKKVDDQIRNLKNALEYANEDSAYAVTTLKTKYQQQINSLNQKHRLQTQQQIDSLNEKYQRRIQSEIKLRQREVEQLKVSNQFQKQTLKQQFQSKFEVINTRNTQGVKEMSLKYKKQMDEKEKKYDSMRVALESERNIEQKMHQQTKMQTKKDKEKLVSELCFLNNQKNQLETDLEQRQKTIKQLKSLVKDKEIMLILASEKHQKKITEIQNEYQQKYEDYQKIQREKIVQINKKYVNQLSNLEAKLRQLQSVSKSKQQLMLENIQELSQNFECRPSKCQDVNQIDQLKWALARKEDEVRKLSRQIKTCNLQLQNKEDLYKRMFRGSSMSRQKKTRQEKEQHIIEEKLGKQGIFRKSNTTDIKYLLKFYHNSK